jgi:hypothetical protein
MIPVFEWAKTFHSLDRTPTLRTPNQILLAFSTEASYDGYVYV